MMWKKAEGNEEGNETKIGKGETEGRTEGGTEGGGGGIEKKMRERKETFIKGVWLPLEALILD